MESWVLSWRPPSALPPPACHTPSLSNFLTHHLSQTICHIPSLSHTIFHTPSFTPIFVTYHRSHTTFWHTIFHTPSVTYHLDTPSFTHHLSHTIFVTYHLSHTTLSHTIFHTPSFTPIFVTYHLSHTTFWHTIFHTPSVTYHLDTPSFTHHLSHTIFVTYHLSHTTLSHTIFRTPSFTPIFVTYHLSHTTFWHTIFHTPSVTYHLDTPSFTHHLSHTIFVTYHLSHTTLSHTIFHTPSFTPIFVTYHLSHTTFWHTIFHTPSVTYHLDTPSFTHHLSHTIFVTYHLSHTTLSHTIFHTSSFTPIFVTYHLSHTTFWHTIFHTPSVTYHLDTPSFTHHLSHTIFVTYDLAQTTLSHTITHHLSHPSLSHTIFHIQLSDTPSFTHPWHLVTSTLISRGRRGAISHPPSFHVAGVALMALGGALGPAWSRVTPRHFAWQAWHLVTSTLVSRGRRGAISHPRSFCVAGVALMALGGALGPAWSRVTPRHFAWQAWHLVTSTLVSRGRRGAISHPRSFCVAGVALMALGGALGPAWSRVTPRHFAWQAWHLVTSTLVSRGRRGAISHPRSFCVAGVALMALGGALGPAWSRVTPRHFAWQAWHLVTSTLVSRGRRGAISHPRSFCVAGVALMALGGALGPAWSRVTPRHFAWQAWHLVTSTLVSRGRRGTISHPRSFCVVGVALMALGGALGPAWSRVTPRHFGRRGTWWHPPWFHVAVVALGDIHLRFAWQAWPLWHWAGCGVTRHLCHTLCHTPSFTHHLWYTLFQDSFAHHLRQTTSFTHPLSHPTLSHTIFDTPSFTYQIVTHHLCHTIFHTQLCHLPSFTHGFVTHHLWHTLFHTPSLSHTHHLSHFVTHHLSTLSHTHYLSHTTLSHTIFHTQLCHTPLCHTPSFTHHPWHTIFHTTLSSLSHTIFHTQLCHPPSLTHHLSHTTLSHTTLSHTPSVFVTHHLSHTTLSHTTLFYFSVLHHLLCLSLLAEVVLWGYSVL